jgi:hypothetical protein
VRLEPSRSSLSGRPEFLQAPKVQTSAPVVRKRKCSSCGLADVAQDLSGELSHSVTVELRYIDGVQNEQAARAKITPYLAGRGWKYKFHLGRFAMERDICRACLIAHTEMEKEFAQKRSRELKSGTQADAYYMALCGDGQ